MSTITPSELKRKIDSGEHVIILDVREPFEYSDWHIPGSVNVPVSNLMHRSFRSDLPKDAEIVAVCAHGFRSESARRVLGALGYDVRSMQGGMVEWNGVYDLAEIGDAGVRIIQVRRIGKGCLSYVVVSGSEAVVIDPTIDIDVYTNAAENAKIVAVIDTHAHADHISGARELADRLGAEYFAPETGRKHEPVKDGTRIGFGSSALHAVAAPGHTPGSMVYVMGGVIFTGDTLFIDGAGRPDLGQPARENAEILFGTLQKILGLSEDTKVLPGHYDASVRVSAGVSVWDTIGEIRQLDVFKMAKHEFVIFASNARPPPNNFELIKEFNLGNIHIDREEFREFEAGSNRCAVK